MKAQVFRVVGPSRKADFECAKQDFKRGRHVRAAAACVYQVYKAIVKIDQRLGWGVGACD
jgi:hypothetical protein